MKRRLISLGVSMLLLAGSALPGFGQNADLEAFKQKVKEKYPDMEIAESESGHKTVAIFVKNQTKKKEMDDEVDGLRDLISAELAGSDTVAIIDKADVVDAFRRYKVTTAEERAGLVEGVFTGGSAVRVGQMTGADFLMLVSLTYTDKRTRKAGSDTITIYSVSASVKVLNSSKGKSVFGETFKKRYPSSAGGGDDAGYFHDLFEQVAKEVAASVAKSAAKWRVEKADAGERVAFSVRTTIDDLIDGLEKGARGKNELLDEVRRVVGGVTVEVDGAAVGSAPGTFKVAPGLHQLKITRQWMQPWQKTVNIQDGATFDVGLELSDAGRARYRDIEQLKAALAIQYAEAAYRKNIKINFDTKEWQTVTVPDKNPDVILQNQINSQ